MADELPTDALVAIESGRRLSWPTVKISLEHRACPMGLATGSHAAPRVIRGIHQSYTAASGWVTPDLATLIHDCHQIGSGCSAVQGEPEDADIDRVRASQEGGASSGQARSHMAVPAAAA